VNELGLDKRVDRPMRGGQSWIEVAPAGAAVTLALVPVNADTRAGVETVIRLKTTDADADNAVWRVSMPTRSNSRRYSADHRRTVTPSCRRITAVPGKTVLHTPSVLSRLASDVSIYVTRTRCP
jgi:hypothetical protein